MIRVEAFNKQYALMLTKHDPVHNICADIGAISLNWLHQCNLYTHAPVHVTHESTEKTTTPKTKPPLKPSPAQIF